jgi:hypothetical protein
MIQSSLVVCWLRMYMNTRSYKKRVNKEVDLTLREKRALCGLPPKGKKKLCKKKQEEIIKGAGIKCRWLYNIVLFEHNCVKVRLTKVPLKHTSFKPAQLIRHFTDDEIRRAANRLWRIKRYYDI